MGRRKRPREIVFDGVTYHWVLGRGEDWARPLRLTIWRAPRKKQHPRLQVSFDPLADWDELHQESHGQERRVTPSVVAKVIERALILGWMPSGGAELALRSDDLGFPDGVDHSEGDASWKRRAADLAQRITNE